MHGIGTIAFGRWNAARPAFTHPLPMVATVILGMLCVHLLCFSTMFLLISKRLDGNRMGMEVFALGNLLLGVAYALQLVGGVADHSAIGFINHTMTLGAPVAYALGAARFFNRPVPVLRRLTDELRVMATQDPLTGLLNRRGLMACLEMHFRSRTAGNAHLLIVDIDHFKRINDTHGHQMGDLVLGRVAQVLQATARKGDLICRLGGEEFLVVALDIEPAGVFLLAERLREAISHSEVPSISAQGPIRCTVTIGVSESFSHPQALDAVLQQADAALYRGKASGRDRVESAFAPLPLPA